MPLNVPDRIAELAGIAVVVLFLILWAWVIRATNRRPRHRLHRRRHLLHRGLMRRGFRPGYGAVDLFHGATLDDPVRISGDDEIVEAA